MILRGKIIRGLKIARTFGIATANIQLVDSPTIDDGVYIVECYLRKEKIEGIMHYGKRETTD